MNIEAIAQMLYERPVDITPHCNKPVPRQYHSWENHILPEMGFAFSISKEMGYAWMFHDVVYSSTAAPGVNETESAFLAKTILDWLHVFVDTNRVETLILATQHKDVPPPEDALIRDLDLLGFAAPYHTFRRNSKLVRAEYIRHDDDIFWPAHLKILSTLMSRGPFFSDEFKYLNPVAQENFRRLIDETEIQKYRGSLA